MAYEDSIRTGERRVALLAAASHGIGQTIAVALAEREASVIATDLKPAEETVN